MTFKSKVIELPSGKISIREWDNRQDNDCYKRAIMSVGDPNDPRLKHLIVQESEIWRIAYAVWLGDGHVKGKTLEETYKRIQDLPISESHKLAGEYTDFVKELSGMVGGDVKKK